MQDLPPELWDQIARYLPESSLINLIGVNKTLTDHGLNAKYRELRISRIDTDLFRRLELIKDLNHFRRVRNVVLEHLPVKDLELIDKINAAEAQADAERYATPVKPATGFIGVTSRMLKRFSIGRKAGPAKIVVPFTAREVRDRILSVLPRLPNIASFTVTQDNNTIFYPLICLIFWENYSAQLQELDIAVHFLSGKPPIPLAFSFPQLRKLTFRAFSYPTHSIDTRPEPLDMNACVCFINKFQRNLEYLRIFNEGKEDLDDIYSTLGRFSNLQYFEVTPPSAAISQGQGSFLQRHADVIRNMTYVSLSGIDRGGLTSIEMERLEKLTLRLKYIPYPDAWWTRPSPFLKSILPTLRSLHLEGALSVKELNDFLTAIRVADVPIALQELSLSVHSLAVDILLDVAAALPNLRSFALQIHDVIAEGSPTTPTEFFPYTSGSHVPNFAVKIREVLPESNWNLQDITIRRQSCCGDLMLWGLMLLCAECVPSIRSFDSQGTKIIPSPPNQKPEPSTSRCSNGLCSYNSGTAPSVPPDIA
ncbi:hypothetical protein FA15DRAFT_657756 [Coprinopsis marcescibilis]|uniref:F-box domain-containing protein n=1 Tax=Coprinopsis marcescibilis TaxID=230819 RepID=A0A5C3KNX7_COPMA|nr:hypothetical protein FA15DRAFT_657756 [Coprinopsis marcescibilis]